MKLILITAVLLISLSSIAQQKPVSESDFTLFNRSLSISNEEAAQVIHLDAKENDGIAWIKARQFGQGTIELDIKGKDVIQQSFVGIAFHGVDNNTYEVIYFRPFNFRSTDPARKLHAVQYVALPDYDWPKLREEHPNQYEKPVDPAPDPNQWFHARIEVKGTTVKVFVNGSSTPSLTVEELTHTNGKMIGYWVGNNADGSWKNLKTGAEK